MGAVTRQGTPPSGTRHIAKQQTTPNLGMKHRRMSESGYKAFSQDIPSDITVEVGGISFCLHKFPLVSQSGRIRKLVVEANKSDNSRLVLPNMPGGSEAFELAAKFCYGIPMEIGISNVAMLRCAAEYLEMSEQYSIGNLIHESESFLNDILINGSITMCVKILQSCEALLPIAERLKIITHCIEATASKACKEQVARSLSQSDLSSSSSRVDSNDSLPSNSTPRKKSVTVAGLAPWAEELSPLRIDFFQRVLSSMRAKGLRNDCLGAAIVHYAQHSLKGLIKRQRHGPTSQEFGHKVGGSVSTKVDDDATSTLGHEQRILIETIVSLLPPEANTVSTAFLFGLLRAAIYLDTTIACRLDLEKRIGMQLEQATLDDFLIPAYSYHGDTLFDVDTIHRIIISFLQQEQDQELSIYKSHALSSPQQSSLMRVARLVDSFLAEIAPDANLTPSKFVAFAELMPEHARVVDDGLYRAVDIFLKAHPGVRDSERKKICGLMDCQKLTQEARSHAAQNERLPVHVVVQVLFFEQMRLKSAIKTYPEPVDHEMQRGGMTSGGPQLSQRIRGGAAPTISPKNDDHYATLCRENHELKMEMARMRTELGLPATVTKDGLTQSPNIADSSTNNHFNKHVNGHAGSHVNSHSGDGHIGIQATQQPTSSSSNKPSSNKFLLSVSKTLGKLNPFQRPSKDSSSLSTEKTPESRRRRRHSVS